MKRLAVATAVAAAAMAPFAPSASALCRGVSTTAGGASYCDENPYWLWCAGASVNGVAGAGACQPADRAGVFVGCWTFQGLYCN